ncbi:MAG: hypothetical protein PUP46_07280 [Endozoicomonas sp. (ex Botrylloides leachii)]|nr:hypothetical protein [Endozoicomonas sp. (ex Botrylloides leachii)]
MIRRFFLSILIVFFTLQLAVAENEEDLSLKDVTSSTSRSNQLYQGGMLMLMGVAQIAIGATTWIFHSDNHGDEDALDFSGDHHDDALHFSGDHHDHDSSFLTVVAVGHIWEGACNVGAGFTRIIGAFKHDNKRHKVLATTLQTLSLTGTGATAYAGLTNSDLLHGYCHSAQTALGLLTTLPHIIAWTYPLITKDKTEHPLFKKVKNAFSTSGFGLEVIPLVIVAVDMSSGLYATEAACSGLLCLLGSKHYLCDHAKQKCDKHKHTQCERGCLTTRDRDGVPLMIEAATKEPADENEDDPEAGGLKNAAIVWIRQDDDNSDFNMASPTLNFIQDEQSE